MHKQNCIAHGPHIFLNFNLSYSLKKDRLFSALEIKLYLSLLGSKKAKYSLKNMKISILDQYEL
jgi:hypothetical protein